MYFIQLRAILDGGYSVRACGLCSCSGASLPIVKADALSYYQRQRGSQSVLRGQRKPKGSPNEKRAPATIILRHAISLGCQRHNLQVNLSVQVGSVQGRAQGYLRAEPGILERGPGSLRVLLQHLR